MRKTEIVFLLAAGALHGALLLSARFLPQPTFDAHVMAVDPIEAVFKEIPVEVAPPPPPSPETAPDQPKEPEPEQKPAARVDTAQPQPAEVAKSDAPPPTPSPETTGAPIAPPVPTGERPPEKWDGPPENGPRVITGAPGLGGAPIWSMPGVLPPAPPPTAAPTAPPPPRMVDKNIAGKVIAEAIAEKDKKLGLDLPAAGTVSSAVRDAVYASRDVPDEGRATITVRLGPDGSVLGASVAGFTGGSPDAWNRMAQAAANSLRAKKLRMNETYAKGATVTVSIKFKKTLPDGSRSGVIRPGTGGASFDLSNIGANAHKNVSVSHTVTAAR